MNCPLCDRPSTEIISTKRRSFYSCSLCGFVWADPALYLSRDEEEKRYSLHENSRENAGYVRFLSEILDQGLQYWYSKRRPQVYHQEGALGDTKTAPLVLDWGAGPNPLASELLQERGCTVYSYDPLFGSPLPLEDPRFDIIFCIEVAEHFKDPLKDFSAMARYLKNGGLLIIHTHKIPCEVFAGEAGSLKDFFAPWWYKEDPTHVSFYSDQSLEVLALCSGLHFIQGENLHFFTKPQPVLVAGGANVDIEGRPYGPLRDRDSNPGRVRFSRGGAGRNMAENLARLNIPVQFIGVFGRDPLSRMLFEETKETGVHLDGVLHVESDSPSCYVSILDDLGDMRLALSSMDSISLLNPEAIRACLEKFSSVSGPEDPLFSALIADGNLLPETIDALLAALPHVPAWFDPVSTAKARRFAAYQNGGLIGRFYGLKPNADELLAMAETLGYSFASHLNTVYQNFIEHAFFKGFKNLDQHGLKKILQAALFLLEKGCRELHVSVGVDGVFLVTKDRVIWGKPPIIPMKSATGAGDSYLAAVVRTDLLSNWSEDPHYRIASGCAASAITLEDEEAVSRNMSPAALYRLINEWKEKGQFTVVASDDH
ncbi:PfkB family carbohydrate kinase [Gracilinema caldarium]|uniref:PfkB family carbohydrate kinase n=1 Tax=Gracilinema caldarium TaxID=215591 RepID=UPI0026F0E4DF|nr:PfkB family carbohydrate kinase [Gracilinema caldarium]